jgi:hypothetical protein
MTLWITYDIKTLCYILSETEEDISGRQKVLKYRVLGIKISGASSQILP